MRFPSRGQIRVAETDAQLEVLTQRQAGTAARGYANEEIIDARTLLDLVPGLSPHCKGALYAKSDGAADPHRTIRAFLRSCREAAVTVSRELNRLLGFPPDAILTTEEIRARYYPGERERLRSVVMEALARGERHAESELRVTWPDGSPHWLLLRAELRDIQDGVPARTLGVALDITERKKAEEHRELLINELNHRVKNTLATIQSIATQSLRNAETAIEARDAVEGRLFALSRAHDVLTRENWDGAFLSEVVQEAIEPFQGSGSGRFDIAGKDVRLPPRMALAVAMAIQELGTNAVKYGALSNQTGRIAISWNVVDGAAGPHLKLLWEETGGPPVATPSRRGFGTRLIERSLAQELHGEASITFAPTGLVCAIRAPLAEDESPNGQPEPDLFKD